MPRLTANDRVVWYRGARQALQDLKHLVPGEDRLTVAKQWVHDIKEYEMHQDDDYVDMDFDWWAEGYTTMLVHQVQKITQRQTKIVITEKPEPSSPECTGVQSVS